MKSKKLLNRLDTYPLVVNFRTLEANLKRAYRKKIRQYTHSMVDQANHLLWNMNRPITWLNAKVNEYSNQKTPARAKHETKDLERQIAQMENEGPAAVGSQT